MSHTSEIVGVVADGRPYRPDRATPPEIYWPIRQYPRLAAYLVVRVQTDVEGIERAARARVAAVHPDVQLSSFVSLNDRLARALVTPRFNLILIGAFALLALLLTAVGVFGVIAYAVASRTHELGLRIALGASPRRLAQDVARHGLVLAGIGMAGGSVVALATRRLLATMLYGLAATDWVTWTLTVGAFGLVATAASYLPARRAARVDPLTALRAE
jgi:putative ABC transport system permease protein